MFGAEDAMSQLPDAMLLSIMDYHSGNIVFYTLLLVMLFHHISRRVTYTLPKAINGLSAISFNFPYKDRKNMLGNRELYSSLWQKGHKFKAGLTYAVSCYKIMLQRVYGQYKLSWCFSSFWGRGHKDGRVDFGSKCNWGALYKIPNNKMLCWKKVCKFM